MNTITIKLEAKEFVMSFFEELFHNVRGGRERENYDTSLS
jgi:hypothetical protein